MTLHYILNLTISYQFLPPAVPLQCQRVHPSYLSLNPHHLAQNLAHCRYSISICWIIQCLAAFPLGYRLHEANTWALLRHTACSKDGYDNISHPTCSFKNLTTPSSWMWVDFYWVNQCGRSEANSCQPRLFKWGPKVPFTSCSFGALLSHYEEVQTILRRDHMDRHTQGSQKPAEVLVLTHEWSWLQKTPTPRHRVIPSLQVFPDEVPAKNKPPCCVQIPYPRIHEYDKMVFCTTKFWGMLSLSNSNWNISMPSPWPKTSIQ